MKYCLIVYCILYFEEETSVELTAHTDGTATAKRIPYSFYTTAAATCRLTSQTTTAHCFLMIMTRGVFTFLF